MPLECLRPVHGAYYKPNKKRNFLEIQRLDSTSFIHSTIKELKGIFDNYNQKLA